MQAAIFEGPGAVEASQRPDPVIQEPRPAWTTIADACQAMDERRAVKSLFQVGAL